ncbi:MAG: hypothetical protein R3320_01290, partial [Nitriliruptorales bacterium]|nr:hypothetical protein [Nitriliruptorales bacterium]
MLTVLGQLTDRPAVSFVRRHAMVAALLAIAALTLLTALGTGDQSPLWGLIAVPLVMSALVLPPRPLAVVAGVTAAGMLAPFAEELNAAQYAGVGATLVVAALLGYTTERARRANQQLAAEADRLRTIADSVHEGLYWMRHVPDSRYVYVNHAMAELSG